MNVYDSRIVAEILNRDGYKETDDVNNADVIIVNTCSVREHAEQKALGRIGNLQKLRKENPHLLIGVVGCMAQNLGNSIKGVDFVVGPSNYKLLPEILRNMIFMECNNGVVAKNRAKCCYTDKSLESYSEIFPEPDNKVTAFVSVMRGCDNYCSYCIVPYVRGRKRSRPHSDILKEIEHFVKRGIKEVTLLGQSVNEYNDEEVSFTELLRLIDDTGIQRVRFTSSHLHGILRTKNMGQELIDVIRDGKNICEWLHLPLQSGSNTILERMNRRYTKEEYSDWVYKIREAIPDVSVTTDIMVGFPGETNEDFNETLKLVKTIKFDFAYMFKYSEREPTSAYHMKPKVAEDIKNDRLTKLIEVQNKITYERNSELVGKTVEVLVEGNSKRGNSLYGRTRTNKVVVFDGNALPGDFVDVKVKQLHGWTPYGLLCGKAGEIQS